MSVHRLAKYQTDDPFTRIPNAALNDSRLDLKSRGLLAFMLSKPDGWTFRERNLAEQTGVGREALRSAMTRLIEAGYVIRTWEPRDGAPPIMVTAVFDRAQTPEVGFPEVGKPDNGKTRPLSNEVLLVTKEAVKRDTGRGKNRKPINPDWRPSLELLQQLKDKFPKVRCADQVEPFLDYWLAKGEARADWDATFRSWIRNQDKWRREREGVSEDGWR